MQGLKESPAYRRRATNLQSLRRSVAWSNPPAVGRSDDTAKRSDFLTERLESLLVLELLKDETNGSGRNYLNLSVRGLYRHVLAAITTKPPHHTSDETSPAAPAALDHHRSRSEGFSASIQTEQRTLGDAVASAIPLGFSPAIAENHPTTTGTRTGAGDHDDTSHRVAFPSLTSAPRTASADIGIPPPPPPPSSDDHHRHRQHHHHPHGLSGNSMTAPLVPPKRRRTVSVGVSPLDPTMGQPHHPLSGAGAVTYRERLGGYLHPRDLRRLVTPFSATNEPELIVRRHVMLLNFDPLRAIVLRDRLLVIVPDGADSILVQLENRVRGESDQIEASIFGTGGGGNAGEVGTTPDDSMHSSDNKKRLKKKNPIQLVRKFFPRNLSSEDLRGAKEPPVEKRGTPLVSELTDDNEDTDFEGNEDDSNHLDDDNDDDELEDEWNELQRHEWAALPFELQSADAVLRVVCTILTDDTLELQQASLEYIGRMLNDKGMTDDPLTIIRAVKDAVREMSSRVKGFVQSLNRVLDEDEDMALMNLSRLLTCPERFIQPVSPAVLEEESDEPELILEAHLQTALTLTNTLDLIQGQIDTAAELVDQKLDAVRNRLLYANMVISILSLCVACASLVGSIFGMNLKIGLEDDPNTFNRVTYGTLAGAIGLAFFIMSILTYSGTFPRSALSLSGDEV